MNVSADREAERERRMRKKGFSEAFLQKCFSKERELLALGGSISEIDSLHLRICKNYIDKFVSAEISLLFEMDSEEVSA